MKVRVGQMDGNENKGEMQTYYNRSTDLVTICGGSTKESSTT